MSKFPPKQDKRPGMTQRRSAKKKTVTPTVSKSLVKTLHPRNLHNKGYDFTLLVQAHPALAVFVTPNAYGNTSIDFADPNAVKQLNAALLLHHYGITHWDIPQGYLCPPIPGRADYLHYLADLLNENNQARANGRIRALDIGTGANGIYPLLGIQSYSWQFVASDIDKVSLDNVRKIVENNPQLASKLSLRLQVNPKAIFSGVIAPDEYFDVTLCNPPFHRSLADASAGTQRKLRNLAKNKGQRQPKMTKSTVELNFGGQKAELWCEGGEAAFLANMIVESKAFAAQCMWFTSLVSKSENLKPCYAQLAQQNAIEVKTIEMHQGDKITRILAWSFLSHAQRQAWAKLREQSR
ncbi:23S rRNA (adenine(1618)-N(6))-methyltransferase RlmF [Shewanella sp.]|uniref:23S rRNA (adenine(1618)-N(6))-methyltransferase RlmF n=1 Tax=Shewanella sp. TaxID=50422 RepID=UPI0040541735